MSNLIKWLLPIFIIALLICFYWWGWIYNSVENMPRYKTTDLNSHFISEDPTSFSLYVTHSKELIMQARRKARQDSSVITVNYNSPEVLIPNIKICQKLKNGKYPKGILLIHGLTDSPYSMHTLAEYFQHKCFLVYVILLPGNGTTPGDLLETQALDWIKTTNFGINTLQQQADHIYIAGFSLGGLLAIKIALENPTLIKGIILFAPSLKINTELTPLIPLIYGLSYLIPHLKWWELHADKATTFYESFASNPIYQLYKILKEVNLKLKAAKVFLPLFIVQSTTDITVDAKANIQFFLNYADSQSQLILYSDNPNDINLKDKRIHLLNSKIPKLNILNFSHLSYTLPSTDLLLGEKGSYKYCLTYKENTENWKKCKNSENTYLGEITEKNLKKHVIQRLTYNPYFHELLNELDIFLSSNG